MPRLRSLAYAREPASTWGAKASRAILACMSISTFALTLQPPRVIANHVDCNHHRLHCSDLWIQERLRINDVRLTKIPGVENPADTLTKNVTRELLEKHLKTMNIIEDFGRASSAPTIEHTIKEKVQSLISKISIRL